MKNRHSGLRDSELVLLAKDGDRSAFEEIYDRHAAGVARALTSFAGPDRDLVDDLTQEVFFRVIEGLTSYVPNRPFSHWLFTIALNVGRNYARGRSRVIAVEPHKLDDIPEKPHRTMDFSGKVITAMLVRLVSALPDHMRDVVSLRIGAGMPFGEIAEMLGIPEGTARSRMHHALRILRDKAGIPISRREIQ